MQYGDQWEENSLNVEGGHDRSTASCSLRGRWQSPEENADETRVVGRLDGLCLAILYFQFNGTRSHEPSAEPEWVGLNKCTERVRKEKPKGGV